jgi:hypothetical protein
VRRGGHWRKQRQAGHLVDAVGSGRGTPSGDEVVVACQCWWRASAVPSSDSALVTAGPPGCRGEWEGQERPLPHSPREGISSPLFEPRSNSLPQLRRRGRCRLCVRRGTDMLARALHTTKRSPPGRGLDFRKPCRPQPQSRVTTINSRTSAGGCQAGVTLERLRRTGKGEVGPNTEAPLSTTRKE